MATIKHRRLAAADNRRLAATLVDPAARIVGFGAKGWLWSICSTLIELPYGYHEAGWLQHRIRAQIRRVREADGPQRRHCKRAWCGCNWCRFVRAEVCVSGDALPTLVRSEAARRRAPIAGPRRGVVPRVPAGWTR